MSNDKQIPPFIFAEPVDVPSDNGSLGDNEKTMKRVDLIQYALEEHRRNTKEQLITKTIEELYQTLVTEMAIEGLITEQEEGYLTAFGTSQSSLVLHWLIYDGMGSNHFAESIKRLGVSDEIWQILKQTLELRYSKVLDCFHLENSLVQQTFNPSPISQIPDSITLFIDSGLLPIYKSPIRHVHFDSEVSNAQRMKLLVNLSLEFSSRGLSIGAYDSLSILDQPMSHGGTHSEH